MTSLRYYSKLGEIFTNLESLYLDNKHEYWLILFREYQGLQAGLGKTVLGLCLLHPTWWKEAGKMNEIGWDDLEPICEYHKINSGCKKCPIEDLSWNKIEYDHWWPESLGGPKSPDNQIVLCHLHNVSKSCSIEYFDFSKPPTWLNRRMRKVQLLLNNDY